MNIKLGFLVLGVILCSANVSYADAELWSANTFQHAFSKELKLNVIRIKNGISDAYFIQLYVGPVVALSKNLEINAYVAPNLTKSGNTWSNNYYGYIDGTYKYEFPWFVFSNRSRFEDNLTTNVFKYRDLVQFSKHGFSFGDEFFFNFSKGFFDEGRSSAAYAIKVSSDLSLSLGYLLRRQKKTAASDWQRTSVWTAGIKMQI